MMSIVNMKNMSRDVLVHHVTEVFTPNEVGSIMSALISVMVALKSTEDEKAKRTVKNSEAALAKFIYAIPEEMAKEFQTQMKEQGFGSFTVMEVSQRRPESVTLQ